MIIYLNAIMYAYVPYVHEYIHTCARVFLPSMHCKNSCGSFIPTYGETDIENIESWDPCTE